MKRFIRLFSLNLIPILIISSTLIFSEIAQAKNSSLNPIPSSLNLPAGQVTASYSNYLAPADASFHITFTGIGNGYDVLDNTTYLGWCLEDHSYPNGSQVTLYSSYDANLPADIKTYESMDIPLVQQGIYNLGDPVPWGEVNWVLNNKGTATRDDIQNAIHLVVWGTATSTGSVSQIALDLAAAAKSHNNFVPKAGQIIAVILYNDGLGIEGRQYQDSIIEVIVPAHPSVSLIKHTNGQIANDPNGADVPQIKPGDPVTWLYDLTNTGNVSIAKSDVIVADNQTGVTPIFDLEISGNGDSVFDPGETWQYKASGTAFDLVSPPPGTKVQLDACTLNKTQLARTAYINMGTASIPGASANATSSYCNPPLPSVSIVKYTNGKTASDPNGADVPQIKPGDPVTWLYDLTNTGNVSIAKSDVIVADNQAGVTPIFDLELSGNGNAVFNPGETWQYKASGTAFNLVSPPPGTKVQLDACSLNETQPSRTAYINMGTASIPGASANATSSYCNPPLPSVSIVKYTNGKTASDPNGADVPQIKPGDPVTWLYDLTNTGNVSIAKSDVIVADNQTGVTPIFDLEISGNGDAVFDPGETWQYKASGTAFDLVSPPPGTKVQLDACTLNKTQPARTAYINMGTASIPGASANATSSYCNPPQPSVSIVKYTNGKTASDPNGADVPQIRPGEPVIWTYKVTNTGNVSILKPGVIVADNQAGVTPVFDLELSGNGDAVFNPGEVWQYRANGAAVDTTLNPPGVTIIQNGCTYLGSMPASPAYVNTATVTIPGASANTTSSYCNPVHYPYFGENGYLGVEDWYDGDYDYNDFGMYIRMEEEITYACNNGVCGPYLTRVIVTTTSVIHDSSMDHLIHLRRPFTGAYSYTVTRSVPADPNPLVVFDGVSGKETPAGTYTGSGDLNVILYNTAKYGRHQKNINENVVVDVTLDSPLLNPRVIGAILRNYTPGSTTFTDLDPIMSNYDFWEEGTLYQSRWHLADTRPISVTDQQSFGLYTKHIPAGTVLPFMIVVPYTNWIPPFESSTITGPYGSFLNYYTTGLPTDWYLPNRVTNACVAHGGLSFGPYPGQAGTCGGVPPANSNRFIYLPVVTH